MRYLIVFAALATALVASPTACAGGWATIGFEPLPVGLAPGDPWNPEIRILQHGLTPLDGLEPTLKITHTASGEEQRFAAAPTGEPGMYATEVVFSREGSWTVFIDSGFGESTLSYGPVQIDADESSAAAASGGRDYTGPILGFGVLVLAAVAVVVFGVTRQRRLRPAG
jgi:hypothetical protein